MNVIRLSDIIAKGQVKGKRVFIRADLYVPQDDTGNIPKTPAFAPPFRVFKWHWMLVPL